MTWELGVLMVIVAIITSFAAEAVTNNLELDARDGWKYILIKAIAIAGFVMLLIGIILLGAKVLCR